MGQPNPSYDTATVKTSTPTQSKWKKHWGQYGIVYIFLVPILIHFMIFQIFPILFSFYITFMDWPIIGEAEFVGLKNWLNFFSDELAWKAIGNTLLFSLYYIVPTMALGLFLALLINSGKKGTGFFKGVFFLPVVTSFVVISGIWSWLFNGTDSGMVNSFLHLVGIPPQLFFSSSKQALIVLAGLSVFKVCGSTMIYYYAGLQSIPAELYEAGRIDGASSWNLFWKITFPLLLPVHFYVAIITTIGSFQIFDSAFLLTSGGPDYSTTTIVYYLYQEGFTSLRLGYASVLAYILFFIIFIISLIQRKFVGKEVTYK
ncbi:carbohydrate ABC transporter permease [Priestia koreensis]|uniref:carbohydrate ABC transporter permease n=1 Tax=Priestia koreensis TaxID=284581 RepID=UPI0028F6E4A1|nr:sugar ABC transporter permease [Priestia koreensis]